MKKRNAGNPTAEKSGRDGRATRIPAEPELEQLVELLDSNATTQGQRDLLNTALRELSDETGVGLPNSDADLRDFYLEAAYCIGAAGPRCRMREILQMIASGEAFGDYKKDDTLYLWKEKRARRKHSGTRETAAEIEKRLSDPKTPFDYIAALKRALRSYSAEVGTKCDAKRPGWTYTEAVAESKKFHYISNHADWCRTEDARTRLIELLEGLRKRRPLSSVRLTRISRPDDDKVQTHHKGGANGSDLLSDLRCRLELLGNDITDCSERMRLEKQIYDLEHPKDPDWNDWSAWEERYDEWKDATRAAIQGKQRPEGK